MIQYVHQNFQLHTLAIMCRLFCTIGSDYNCFSFLVIVDNLCVNFELIIFGLHLHCQTFATWQTDNGQVCRYNCDLIEQALTDNFVPVLSGDVVFDLTKGCNVLSSDVLMKVDG